MKMRPPAVLSRSDIEEIKNDICELKTTATGQTGQASPVPKMQSSKGACFGCGQKDHMIRSCPFKQNQGNFSRSNDRNNHQNRSGYNNGY